jgi:hypothetical protein
MECDLISQLVEQVSHLSYKLLAVLVINNIPHIWLKRSRRMSERETAYLTFSKMKYFGRQSSTKEKGTVTSELL